MALDAWRCANEFGLSFRGHWKNIPVPEVLSESEILEILNLSPDDPKYQDVINRTNFNAMYDSYFAPCDFLLTCLTVRLPKPLPIGAKYKTEFKINGVPIEKMSVMEQKDSNMIILNADCATPIFEDDFIEMKVVITDPPLDVDNPDQEQISFPEHNMVYGVGGIVDYRFYRLAWIDPDAAVVIDLVAKEEIDLTEAITEVDGFTVENGMIILLPNQTDSRENGVYIVVGEDLVRHESALGFSSPIDFQDRYLYVVLNDFGFWTVTYVEVDPREIGEAERSYNSQYQDYLYQTDLWDQCQLGDTASCDSLAEIQGSETPSQPVEPEIPVVGTVWGRDGVCFGKLNFECPTRYFKQDLLLQNRSGNREISDRYLIDQIRSPISFQLQSIRLSAFEDELVEADIFQRPPSCFYVDVVVNNKSILPLLGFDQPISLDTVNDNYKVFDLEFLSNTGFAIKRGDKIELRIYQRNRNAKYNGKIIQCYLAGCQEYKNMDAVDIVGVFELCDELDPCRAEVTDTEPCEAPPVCTDPSININITGGGGVRPTDEREYVTLNGIYVTINGERIWLGG
jgi:hypothetical protein